MKKIFTLGILTSIYFTSCTEVPVAVDTTERGRDTTYIAELETPQPKMFLIEEPSGVECVNCPAGTEELKNMNASGPFQNKLAVVTLHSGSLTTPFNKPDKVSKYDFRTDLGLQILNSILGGDIGKPAAAFDRLPIAITGGMEGKLLDYRNNWGTMLNQANTINGNNPVNVHIKSTRIEDNEYEIEVKVSYTQNVTGKHAITVYMLEDKIQDLQEFPTGIKMYEHNNIFRTVISPFNGLEILADLEEKEAGRVFIQNFIFKVDPSDTKQADWNLDNMRILAFVHQVDATSKKVFQTNTLKLKN